MSDALNRVLREARRDWAIEARNVRWDAVERRLFARIASDQRAERSSLVAPGGAHAWSAAAAGLASAAAIAFVVVGTHDVNSLEPERAAPVDDTTNIARIDGAGSAWVNGRAVAAGTQLHLNDIIEARGAQVTLSRPGKVTLMVERGSSAVVTHVRGALVLALEKGAIEAQVVPVASSEAFAVDVGPARVAVHGTRFRVARAGERVALDLNEGVVAIGQVPRVGSTQGGMVTAPAHAEFAAGDPEATLRVTHDLALIRAPAAMEASPQVRLPAAAAPPSPPAPGATKLDAGEVVSPIASGTSRTESHTSQTLSGWAGTATVADPNAQLGIVAAVRSCLTEHLHADSVTVISSTLFLQLHEDGSVGSARFEPPVAPDVNACAAESIYRARFTHGGPVVIPIAAKN